MGVNVAAHTRHIFLGSAPYGDFSPSKLLIWVFFFFFFFAIGTHL